MELSPNLPLNNHAMRFAAAFGLAAALSGCTPESSESPNLAINTPQPTATIESPSPELTPNSPEPSASAAPKPKPRPTDTTISMQRNLNSLLVPLGMPALELDGKLGGQTKRALCAERLFSGHAASLAAPTAKEKNELRPNQQLHSTLTGFILSRTCQVLAVNQNNKLSMIIPISTGRPGYTTPAGMFHINYGRYGWHNSSLYPAESGNGNMYKPLYFNGAIAVHGSQDMYNASSTPRSHGCTRTKVSDQDKLWALAGGPATAKQNSYVSNLRPIPVTVL